MHEVGEHDVAAERDDLEPDPGGEPRGVAALDPLDELLEVVQVRDPERHDHHDHRPYDRSPDQIAVGLQLGDPRVALRDEHARDEHGGGRHPASTIVCSEGIQPAITQATLMAQVCRHPEAHVSGRALGRIAAARRHPVAVAVGLVTKV
jgi:hypothetical protein